MTDILDYLDRQKDNIKDHLKIKYPNKLVPYATHISKDNNLKEMYPQIGNRQSPSEDRTIPRICVCDALIDCINGYQAILSDYNKNIPLIDNNRSECHTDTFRGGWYIYHIPYTHGLIPDNTLVGDQSVTNEYWLVNYKNNTSIIYYPNQIGKFFIKNHTRSYHDKKGIKHIFTMYLEIDSDLILIEDIVLSSGKYELQYIYNSLTNDPSDIRDILVKYEKIDDNTYNQIKENTVSLLSYSDTPFIHW